MFVHSKNGRHFLGCRTLPSGKVQVVYDCEGADRTIFNVGARTTANKALHDAIHEAIGSSKVVPTLYAKLSAHNITISEAS